MPENSSFSADEFRGWLAGYKTAVARYYGDESDEEPESGIGWPELEELAEAARERDEARQAYRDCWKNMAEARQIARWLLAWARACRPLLTIESSTWHDTPRWLRNLILGA